MRRVAGILLVVLLGSTMVIVGASRAASGKRDSKKSMVERGKYMVEAGHCNQCHTPFVFNKDLQMPVPDMSRLLSGHPQGNPDAGGTLGPTDIVLVGPSFTQFKLPFGVVYSQNLTPDKETGLGKWTEAMFIKALRTGKHMGEGRPILPPMPWLDVMMLTDDDLKAVYAYLQSIPPIKNAIPEPKVPPKVIEGVGQSFQKVLQMMKAGPH